MHKYPDINNPEDIVEAIRNLNVLGGYSRSFTVDTVTGIETPDRYVEHLSDYFSDYAIKTAVDILYKNTHRVNGLDGVIIYQSADELTIRYVDGSEKTFVLKKSV